MLTKRSSRQKYGNEFRIADEADSMKVPGDRRIRWITAEEAEIEMGKLETARRRSVQQSVRPETQATGGLRW